MKRKLEPCVGSLTHKEGHTWIYHKGVDGWVEKKFLSESAARQWAKGHRVKFLPIGGTHVE